VFDEGGETITSPGTGRHPPLSHLRDGLHIRHWRAMPHRR
jgi:hypothetical protein